jgi:hypothetical protein
VDNFVRKKLLIYWRINMNTLEKICLMTAIVVGSMFITNMSHAGAMLDPSTGNEIVSAPSMPGFDGMDPNDIVHDNAGGTSSTKKANREAPSGKPVNCKLDEGQSMDDSVYTMTCVNDRTGKKVELTFYGSNHDWGSN